MLTQDGEPEGAVAQARSRSQVRPMLNGLRQLHERVVSEEATCRDVGEIAALMQVNVKTVEVRFGEATKFRLIFVQVFDRDLRGQLGFVAQKAPAASG